MLDPDVDRLIRARQAIVDAMGGDALVDSAAVAALFNAIDRVADSTGQPLEEDKAAVTAVLRAEIGIDAFASQKMALEEDAASNTAE